MTAISLTFFLDQQVTMPKTDQNFSAISSLGVLPRH
jgi:hypothetical protein